MSTAPAMKVIEPRRSKGVDHPTRIAIDLVAAQWSEEEAIQEAMEATVEGYRLRTWRITAEGKPVTPKRYGYEVALNDGAEIVATGQASSQAGAEWALAHRTNAERRRRAAEQPEPEAAPKPPAKRTEPAVPIEQRLKASMAKAKRGSKVATA